ncbi:MAG: FAD-dependent oxidoreductase [Candidatus Bathyarchaeia archaeon]|jgi:thioredoxin reductase (NADPH)
MSNLHEVIIVGGGPAGLAAAIHCGTFGLRTLVLEAEDRAGGLATKIRRLENYPGFQRKVSGLRLTEKMAHQAEKNGAELHISEEVTNLSLGRKDKVVETRRGTYKCKALILATGDGMKGIGMKWETWLGAGVAYCAECGAPFLKGKDIVVVGNVKDAIDEALRLTSVAKNVRLVNHSNMIEVDEQARKQLEKRKIGLIECFEGKEIKGRPPSKQLALRHLSGSGNKTLRTNMIFVVAGVKPFVSVLRNAGIETHRQGCVVVDGFGRTSVEGVFAAGGCASTIGDLVPACVGDGAAVATCARLYLAYGC